MANLKNKAATAAIAALLISLPADEGKINKPYRDIAGVLTVCYGHTGPDIENRSYSDAECLALLRKDVEKHMTIVQNCSKREIPLYPLIGFTSFQFNTGAWCTSRSAREWNAGNVLEACRAMAYSPSGQPAWSYVNRTRFVDGLFQRRKREMNVCLTNSSTP